MRGRPCNHPTATALSRPLMPQLPVARCHAEKSFFSTWGDPGCESGEAPTETSSVRRRFRLVTHFESTIGTGEPTRIVDGTSASMLQNLVSPQITHDCSQIEEESNTKQRQADQEEHHHRDRGGFQQTRDGQQKAKRACHQSPLDQPAHVLILAAYESADGKPCSSIDSP